MQRMCNVHCGRKCIRDKDTSDKIKKVSYGDDMARRRGVQEKNGGYVSELGCSFYRTLLVAAVVL